MSKKKKLFETSLTSFSDLGSFFLVFFFVNVITMLIAAILFPQQVVLGTHLFSPLQALFQSIGLLTLLVVAVTPVLEWVANRWQYKLKNRDWLAVFWLVNIVALWIIARLAELVGLGLASWKVAVVLGTILNLLQGWAVKNLLQSKMD